LRPIRSDRRDAGTIAKRLIRLATASMIVKIVPWSSLLSWSASGR
jgi:hypothetical protein